MSETPSKTDGSGAQVAAKGAGSRQPEGDASGSEIALLVLFLLLVFVVLVGLLLGFWPDNTARDVRLLGMSIPASRETRMFMLVIGAGALGAYVHAATSAADFIGNRRLRRQWIAWYLLRLPVGASLAFILYLLLYDTLGSKTYYVAGVSALAGMFSKQAMNKLSDLFDTIFQSKSQQMLKDGLKDEAPILIAIVPDRISTEGGTVRLVGAHFAASTKVLADGHDIKSTFISQGELRVSFEAKELVGKKSIALRVVSADMIDGKSEPKMLAVEPSNPALSVDTAKKD